MPSLLALGLACALLAGCSHAAQRQGIIRALRLHVADHGISYRTPDGCRVEALLVDAAQVSLYTRDDFRTVLANPRRTLGVKAVRDSGACQRELRSGLATLR